MAYVDKEKQRAAWRRWYHRHKKDPKVREYRRAAKRRDYEVRVGWYRELKASLACVRCGESHPACLAFHHREKGTKSFTVAAALRLSYSRARIEAEMAKCDVLCLNCHLRHHARDRAVAGGPLPERVRARRGSR